MRSACYLAGCAWLGGVAPAGLPVHINPRPLSTGRPYPPPLPPPTPPPPPTHTHTLLLQARQSERGLRGDVAHWKSKASESQLQTDRQGARTLG